MELLKAIERLNALESDIKDIDEWLSYVRFNNKPVTGRSWVKLEVAIQNVIGDLNEEIDELKNKITKATDGIEIDC